MIIICIENLCTIQIAGMCHLLSKLMGMLPKETMSESTSMLGEISINMLIYVTPLNTCQRS